MRKTEICCKLRPLSWMVGLGAVMMAVTITLGQEPAAPPPPLSGHGDVLFIHGPGPVEALHGDIGEGRTVTGVPLTADFVVSHDNTLSDGNRIHKENTTRLYRDSQGRIRREMTVSLATTATGSVTRTMVMIKDPVSGKRYMLDTETKTAREIPMHEGHGRGKGHGVGIGAPGGTPLDGETAGRKPMEKSVTEQDLGTKPMDGFSAEGLRVTRTIAAGEIGNERPIEVVTERWYSPDLQLPVLITHTDPMMGSVSTKMTSVTRGEPDASLFQVPSDYKVVNGGPGEPFYVPLPK